MRREKKETLLQMSGFIAWCQRGDNYLYYAPREPLTEAEARQQIRELLRKVIQNLLIHKKYKTKKPVKATETQFFTSQKPEFRLLRQLAFLLAVDFPCGLGLFMPKDRLLQWFRTVRSSLDRLGGRDVGVYVRILLEFYDNLNPTTNVDEALENIASKTTNVFFEMHNVYVWGVVPGFWHGFRPGI